MNSYLQLMRKILQEGHPRMDRTGTGARSLFGERLEFWLGQGFPLVTTKRVSFHGVAHELLWFISGSTNIKYLQKQNVTIWDEWADAEGNLGPVYGKQWRDWSGIDQLKNVIEGIQTNPYGRRHIVSAWNVKEIEEMALPPCHLLYQFFVEDNRLSCQMYQRSADYFLGVPYNIASYALLTHLVAGVCGLVPSRLILVFGDVHLYDNHLDQAQEQLKRSPRSLPQLGVTPQKSIDDYRYEHLVLTGYNPHPAIKAPIAV